MPIEIVGIIQTIIAIALATELERHRDRSDDHPPGTCRNGARKAVGMKTKKYRVKPRMPVSTPNSNQPVLSTEEAVNAWMERMAERERRTRRPPVIPEVSESFRPRQSVKAPIGRPRSRTRSPSPYY